MLPAWLAWGLAITGVVTVVVAAMFVLGERLFPTEPVTPAEERSGEWKRRREIRAYLRAIEEPFAEDHFVAGTHVAFYLPRRDVAITFDAPDYFRIRNAETDAVLAEHEMPGAHLGGRLPFETPDPAELFDEPEAERDEEERVSDAFETLGVSRSASESELKAAYRERVKEVHPDRGGDRETFERVREAYAAARQAATSGR
ncbi:J domain-containing protein [Halobacterium litoreum]|uniref:J domain-containing protein n=1 Tax=Halobacterium litoreum TaxID=2039234 RepID=A0ABD5NHB7_9EURY|nr:J domain-containing protein [Halobacterium litoreum]UHH12499.1 J domain-containing protein [Halobacterium litoreum]